MPEISRDTAKSLVSQFTAFAPLPQAREGLTLTIDTLIASARSESHARRIVAEIVDAPGDPARWPSPDRIRSVAWALLTESEKAAPCQECGGSGWRHFVRMVGGVPLDFSTECSCRPRAPAVASSPRRDGKMSSAAETMEDVTW